MHRLSALFAAVLLCSTLFFIESASALNVTVNPNEFDFYGNKGDVVTETALVTNGESNAIHMRVTTNETNLTFVPANITLSPNASANLAITYILPKNISQGQIFVTFNDSNITVWVRYIEFIQQQAPVDIFPSPAISDNDLAIFFTGTNKGLKAKGFLSVNGFIYSVDMDGFCIVHLDKAAYGPATLYLFGNSILQNDSMKTFTIQQGVTKEVSLSVPKTGTVDTYVSATVLFGNDPLGNQEVVIEDPNGSQNIQTTDNRGKIEFTPTEIGRWKLKTTAEGQTAIGSIDVKYGVLLVGIAEESYKLGDTITLVSEPTAKLSIYIDNDYETSLTADSDGKASLLLSKGGDYRIEGELGNTRGDKSFTIPRQAEIILLDASERAAAKIEPTKRYTIQVADADGNPIGDVASVWISTPSGTRELLPLTSGQGSWTPMTVGPYTISVDDSTSAAGNSRFVNVKNAESQLGLLTIGVGFIIFLVIIFGILAIIARSKGVPFAPYVKSLVMRKKRPELPVDE